MKYSIKPKNDSDKENAKQLELIMNHKLATYDDISEIIKERVDNFELKDNTLEERLSIEAINEMLHDLTEFGMTTSYVTSINNGKGISIQLINPMAMHAVMPSVIGGLNHNIIIADDIELAKMKEPGLIQFDCCKEEKKPKENHPHGWYRKFDKKRF